jgi:Mg2+-importing ATPase
MPIHPTIDRVEDTRTLRSRHRKCEPLPTDGAAPEKPGEIAVQRVHPPIRPRNWFKRPLHSAEHNNSRVDPFYRQIAQLNGEEALARLKCTRVGLSVSEAAERRAKYGPNAVSSKRQRPLPLRLIAGLWTPLNIMLLSLALVSLTLGDARAAFMIAAMVILSVGLSFLQEYRSDKAAAKLCAMVHTTASAIRPSATAGSGTVADGSTEHPVPTEVPIEQLVPGDLVALTAGDMIPADLRLIATKDLFLNQATLTGEVRNG